MFDWFLNAHLFGMQNLSPWYKRETFTMDILGKR